MKRSGSWVKCAIAAFALAWLGCTNKSPDNPGAGGSYQVVYSGNGSTTGIPPVDNKNYTPGQTVSVLGNSGNLAKTGFTFAGWNTQPDGQGLNYLPNQKVTMPASELDLFADWDYQAIVEVSPSNLTLVLPTNSPQTFTIGNNGTSDGSMTFQITEPTALGGFLDYTPSSGTVRGGESALVVVSVKKEFTNTTVGDLGTTTGTLVGATLGLEVNTPGAVNYTKVAVPIQIQLQPPSCGDSYAPNSSPGPSGYFAPGQSCPLWFGFGQGNTLSIRSADPTIITFSGTPIPLPMGYAGPYPPEPPYVMYQVAGPAEGGTTVYVTITYPDGTSFQCCDWQVTTRYRE